MEVNVNGNVTLTIQPSESLIALFGSLVGGVAKPTETVKKETKKQVKIEEKEVVPTIETAQCPEPVENKAEPEVTQSITEATTDVVKPSLEEVTNVVKGYLGTQGSEGFDARRNNIKALNGRYGGAMSTVYANITPAQVAAYVQEVKNFS